MFFKNFFFVKLIQTHYLFFQSSNIQKYPKKETEEITSNSAMEKKLTFGEHYHSSLSLIE